MILILKKYNKETDNMLNYRKRIFENRFNDILNKLEEKEELLNDEKNEQLKLEIQQLKEEIENMMENFFGLSSLKINHKRFFIKEEMELFNKMQLLESKIDEL
jgi:hypothetical protein